MMIHTAEEKVSPSVIAAFLLVAIDALKTLGLDHPTNSQVLDATGSSRSRAYELKPRIEAMLEQITGAAGRPPKPVEQPDARAEAEITKELLGYVYRHPGCVVSRHDRNRYSDGFRHFVLELLERDGITADMLSGAGHIPQGTLKDWLQGGKRDVDHDERDNPPSLHGPMIETVLDEWSRWKGDFVPFCEHVKRHCHVPFGVSAIATILEAYGVRKTKPRGGRSPDEKALRGSFVTFFPHAQWVGDGTMVPVMVNGELTVFNVELDVDAYSAAVIGAHVSLVEDSAAVIETFREAVETSGTRPIALLLDNKPSNHTQKVKEELDDTLLIRATPFRGQNKAHVEGAFGLLKPSLEGLELEGQSPHSIAASFLQGLVIAWARALNHRPRKDRSGKSRAQLLSDRPTDEQIEHAKDSLARRLQAQERARRTLAARQNPAVRKMLADAYDRLGLDDPDGNILTATARYPLDAVVEAIAIFEGRTRAKTLPENADARYLMGIARNITTEREGWEIAQALWEARVTANDIIAQTLNQRRSEISSSMQRPEVIIKSYVDLAMETQSRIEAFFWLRAAGDAINEDQDCYAAYKLAARRISATHAAPQKKRLEALRFLAAHVIPLS